MTDAPPSLDAIRQEMRAHIRAKEATSLSRLLADAELDEEVRRRISERAVDLVRTIRDDSNPGLMEVFLEEYGLSTDEGIALMCLAEALLRVPDADTIDALIEDKIAPSDWGRHLGKSSSSLVNASTWALLLTGKVLDDDQEGVVGALRGAVKRLGEPMIRTAVSRAMKEMGRQFVLGREIGEAMARAKANSAFTYSYDMLGEAAFTERDARRYHLSYSEAIAAIAKACVSDDIRENPGISVKLSALHPRYEFAQRDRALEELVPRVRALALLAKSGGMGFNIDAEEAARLDLSLDVIEAVVSDPALKGWDGFGVVVQAYGPRAGFVIDWLYALAEKLDRRFMVRLVKGAYWDTEVKLAQTLGLEGFPVFTRKSSTDVCYITCARKLLGMTDRIYPQFATHNAHTVAAVLTLATDKTRFEFQRLHGMGESLHKAVLETEGTRCRIYAPVGAHRDLLAYLVRRLLENGANSSFVNQIVDESVPPEEVAADPFSAVEAYLDAPHNPAIALPPALYGAARRNAKGWDITDPSEVADLATARDAFAAHTWDAGPMIAGSAEGAATLEIRNPARPDDLVGSVTEAAPGDVESAIARGGVWAASAEERAAVLRRAADLYESHAVEFFALASREAGKSWLDGVGELREAVDFLRYYAGEALKLTAGPRGLFACISPWNFPLAIFTGQLSAALAAGNGVIAKPAETTPLIAAKAVALLREAGVPSDALQLLPGRGDVVGAALAGDPRLAGMCFTGSTATAQRINRAMAARMAPDAPLIAETGGLNAMIVDSTALPEQAVRDILASSFQSAGQRCSALRLLYVQQDIAKSLLGMLFGAMDELRIGDPWVLSTDVGPVIDTRSKTKIVAHIEAARAEGRVMKELAAPESGFFVAPTVLRVAGIDDLKEEIFGPVLHVATFAAEDIDHIVDRINASGFGLTFGLHSRIDDRVQQIVDRLRVGNAYVNRNQIGAIVGSQPFGGEGLSGTGPKAGGPHYVPRFAVAERPRVELASGGKVDLEAVQNALNRLGRLDRNGGKRPLLTLDLPGPTGESNRLSSFPRGIVLCLGPDRQAAKAQAAEARAQGCAALEVAPGAELDGTLDARDLSRLEGFDAVAFWGGGDEARALREALAARPGAILPLICETGDPSRYHLERHICIDTTASGGNAALLAASGAA